MASLPELSPEERAAIRENVADGHRDRWNCPICQDAHGTALRLLDAVDAAEDALKRERLMSAELSQALLEEIGG